MAQHLAVQHGRLPQIINCIFIETIGKLQVRDILEPQAVLLMDGIRIMQQQVVHTIIDGLLDQEQMQLMENLQD